MPRGRSDRGQARRTRIELNAALSQAKALVADHKQTCARCKVAGHDVFKRCDWGWELAKIELRAQRAIERYETDHESKQERMF